MKKMKVNKKEAAALELLRSTGVDVLEAALLAKMAPGGGVGQSCPPLAAGCAAAYFCELPFGAFSQLFGAAV